MRSPLQSRSLSHSPSHSPRGKSDDLVLPSQLLLVTSLAFGRDDVEAGTRSRFGGDDVEVVVVEVVVEDVVSTCA